MFLVDTIILFEAVLVFFCDLVTFVLLAVSSFLLLQLHSDLVSLVIGIMFGSFCVKGLNRMLLRCFIP